MTGSSTGRSLRPRLSQRRVAPYVLLAPFFVLFTAFFLWPLIESLRLSFYRTTGTHRRYFVGLENYAFLLRDRFFWLAVANTVGFGLVFVAIQLPLSLGLALLLNHPRVWGRRFLRLVFFSTHLVGGVFVGVIFTQILRPRDGLLNDALSFLLQRPIQVDWLGRPELAMAAVLIASLWLSTGYGMIYFLAALAGVNRELHDAAAVDGAGRWSRFWHITLPAVRPVAGFLGLVGFIGAMQLFELPYVLFGQSAGPANAATTVVMYLYFAGFQVGDLGYAAAIGWVLVLLTVGFAIGLRRTARGML